MKSSWSYFLQTFPYIMGKLNVTLTLTTISAAFSLVVGVVFAIISHYKVKGASQVLEIRISSVRGISVAAQLFFFYYGLANLSSLILNMSPTVAAVVITSLNMGIFASEPIREVLIPTDEGQREVATAFDMTGFQMTIEVVTPQAVRVTLPPLFSDLINLFRMPFLAFLVGVRDVTGATKIEGANTFQFFEHYVCVMLIY